MKIRLILRIARTELASLFYSPVAWMLLVVFAVQVGIDFLNIMRHIVMIKALGTTITFSVTAGYVLGMHGIFEVIQHTLYLYIPLLTMNVMCREYTSGSVKLVFSSPVSSADLVSGKFLALVWCSLIFTAILALPVVAIAATTPHTDFGLVASGLLSMFLLMATYCAIGLFMSSLTNYQVVAAVITFAALAFLNYIGSVGQDNPVFREITHWLCINNRASDMVSGLISTNDVIYFIAVSALFVWWTVMRIDDMHQRRSLGLKIARYAGVLAIVVAVGYVSSRPALIGYLDATRGEQRTLSQGSREVMKRLEGPMTITTYVNILDSDYNSVSPQERKKDESRFNQYLRYKPDLELKYVYYCRLPENDSAFYANYPGMTPDEIRAELARTQNLSPKMLTDLETISEDIDLSRENYGFVRVIDWNGRQARLRLYNDMERHPSEREISAGLKSMLDEPARVGVLTGHGERSIRRKGDRDFSIFATLREYRHSMINQGFELHDIDLSAGDTISADMDILLIADPRTELSDDEYAVLDQYISRGGNLMIMVDEGHQQASNPLLARFGAKALDGVLTQPSDIGLYGFTPSRPTTYAADSMRGFYRAMAMRLPSAAITMPTAVALEVTDTAGYDTQVTLCSDSIAWIEMQTTDFTSAPELNPETGEQCGSYITQLRLKRNVGDKEQRILITGDADCLSNSELQIGNRKGMRSYNSSMISGSFLWLSHGRFPVSVVRPDLIDRDTTLTPMQLPWVRFIYIIGIPALIALIGFVVLWRRRKG